MLAAAGRRSPRGRDLDAPWLERGTRDAFDRAVAMLLAGAAAGRRREPTVGSRPR